MPRIDRILDSGETPMLPLLPAAAWPCPAISDAIQDPCTPQPGLLGGVSTPVRLGPGRTDPTRSGTSGLTPLSITATVTPWPWLLVHAACAWIASRTHCSWLRTLSARAGDVPPMTVRHASTAAVPPRAVARQAAVRPAPRAVSIQVLRGRTAWAGPCRGLR